MALPFRLVVITDWAVPDCFERVCSVARALPSVVVQHRHPGATDRVYFDEARRLAEAIGGARLFINSRVDVARALGAHLHLSERALSPADVRPLMPPGALLSASWHEGTPARAVDFLLLSPVFDPSSKPRERPPLGPARFEALARGAGVPVFALGGITAANVGEVRGAAGVAVIGEVVHAADPVAAARRLTERLEGW
ncbi:MAG: thiamine phosphate synthase [Myxococcaceae bacterium]